MEYSPKSKWSDVINFDIAIFYYETIECYILNLWYIEWKMKFMTCSVNIVPIRKERNKKTQLSIQFVDGALYVNIYEAT